MWLFTKTGFVSLVEKPGDREAKTLTVRSRDFESLDCMREDIYRLYDYQIGEAEILEDQGSDYKYRMVVSVEEIKRYMVAVVEGIDYENYKNEITTNRELSGGDQERTKWHDALMDVWVASFGLGDSNDQPR